MYGREYSTFGADPSRYRDAAARGTPGPAPRGAPQGAPRGVPRGVPQVAPRGMPRSAPRLRERFGGEDPGERPEFKASVVSEDEPRRLSRNPIDVHEMLKREAFFDPQPSCDDHFEKNRPCPSGVHGISDQYVILDSFRKVRSSNPGRGEFTWNFMVQGVTGDQVVGIRDEIDTVIEIQMGSFAMPIIPEVPYVLHPVAVPGFDQLLLTHNNTNAVPPLGPQLSAPQYPAIGPWTTTLPAPYSPWVNNPYTQVPCFDRMTIQIREAGLQSYSDANGARHHYDYTLTVAGAAGANPTMLLALPQAGSLWDTFIFTRPLKDVHGLTLIFRNPDIPIRFEPDCFYDVPLEDDGTGALRIRAPGHGLNMGDRIFVSGCQSGSSLLDPYINRPEGHVAAGDPALAALPPGTPIVLADPDVFYFDPSISVAAILVTPPVLPQIVTVCIAKRRLRIPIRMRRVVPYLSNYVAP